MQSKQAFTHNSTLNGEALQIRFFFKIAGIHWCGWCVVQGHYSALNGQQLSVVTKPSTEVDRKEKKQP